MDLIKTIYRKTILPNLQESYFCTPLVTNSQQKIIMINWQHFDFILYDNFNIIKVIFPLLNDYAFVLIFIPDF